MNLAFKIPIEPIGSFRFFVRSVFLWVDYQYFLHYWHYNCHRICLIWAYPRIYWWLCRFLRWLIAWSYCEPNLRSNLHSNWRWSCSRIVSLLESLVCLWYCREWAMGKGEVRVRNCSYQIFRERQVLPFSSRSHRDCLSYILLS